MPLIKFKNSIPDVDFSVGGVSVSKTGNFNLSKLLTTSLSSRAGL